MTEDVDCDLCLVVPPFADIDRPPLGASVLAAACRERGLRVTVVHASLMLADLSGYAVYQAVCTLGPNWMAGEQMFVDHAYDPDLVPEMRDRFEQPADIAAKQAALAPAIAPFLDAVTERILALRPRIVGLSSAFQQNVAAGAIARRVRAGAPDACIVMGGPNVASPMAEALVDVFPAVDYFFSGEADIVFPDFCEKFIRDGARPANRVIHCAPLFDMRRSPAPDFEDYFVDLRAAQARGDLPQGLPRMLPLETSRGCWWGAKHHCTFCGLNGTTMAFREKPADYALAEIDMLTTRWGVSRLALADNIMPLRYLTDLLPTLAAREERPRLFYEVKANLSEGQLALMAQAGIDIIQPGIEALSSNLLRLMRKGVSAHQNITLLRACRALDIEVIWNHLSGFPDESPDDYLAVAALVPKIEHLQPPRSFSGIVIDRYSPHFDDAEEFGIAPLTPRDSYRGLYPAAAPLADIAYHFRGSYSTAFLDDGEAVATVKGAFARWGESWDKPIPPMLRVVRELPAGIVIADTRAIAREGLTVISHAADAVLRRFERAKSRDGVEGDIAVIVDDLLARDFLIDHEGKLLSIVTRDIDIAPSAHAPANDEQTMLIEA